MTPLGWVLVILIAWIFGVPALIVALTAIRGACRKLRARWTRLVAGKPAHHPGLPFDGWPLTVAERERWQQIERGMWKTASEPGRQR